MLLTFSSISYGTEKGIDLKFDQNSSKYWQYISDRVMGGISNGQAALEQDGQILFARLSGNVSTKNNGGFIQLRSRFSFADFEKNGNKIKGVRLNVRGNGEIYHIFIRTNETRSYSDYYSTSFTAKSKWTIIDLPFNQFKHNITNNSNLEDKNIRTFGIVAYGRDFESDVSVSEIIFYY